MHPMSWHRYVNLFAWQDAGRARLHLARGVYWGNLLGPEICAKIGDGVSFAKEFEAYCRSGVYHPQSATLDNNNRLLLLLSDDPMDMVEVDGQDAKEWTVGVAAWLQRRLREVGALL